MMISLILVPKVHKTNFVFKNHHINSDSNLLDKKIFLKITPCFEGVVLQFYQKEGFYILCPSTSAFSSFGRALADSGILSSDALGSCSLVVVTDYNSLKFAHN